VDPEHVRAASERLPFPDRPVGKRSDADNKKSRIRSDRYLDATRNDCMSDHAQLDMHAPPEPSVQLDDIVRAHEA